MFAENASENVAEASGSHTASNVHAEMYCQKEIKRRQVICNCNLLLIIFFVASIGILKRF